MYILVLSQVLHTQVTITKFVDCHKQTDRSLQQNILYITRLNEAAVVLNVYYFCTEVLKQNLRLKIRIPIN